MVNILFIHDDRLLATPGTVRKLLDPACGTGGMLAEAQTTCASTMKRRGSMSTGRTTASAPSPPPLPTC